MFRYGILFAFVGTALAATFAQIETDLSNIASGVTTLDNAIITFEGSDENIIDALDIHDDAQSLVTTINTATSDVTSFGTFTAAEGQTILSNFTDLTPPIIKSIDDVVAAHEDFENLPLGGSVALVEADLKSLSSASSALETALINAAPANIKPSASALASSINAAFATAIAAYTS